MRTVLTIIVFAFLFSWGSLYAQQVGDPEEPEEQQVADAVDDIRTADAEIAPAAEEELTDVAEVAEQAAEAESETERVSLSIAELRELLRLMREGESLANDVMTTVDEIPVVDDVAGAVQAVDDGLEEIERGLNDAIEPTDEAVSRFKKTLAVGKKSLEVILAIKLVYEIGELIVAGYQKWFGNKDDAVSDAPLETSLQSSSDQKNYACIARHLKTFSNDYKPLVHACNKTLKHVKDPVKDLKKLFPKIKTYGKKLEKDIKPVSKFASNSTKTLKKTIKKLKNILDDKIDFKFKVHIWGFKHVFHIRLISVKEGLQGVDHIIHKLEKRIGPELKEAVKLFGINKIAKEIEKLAKKAFGGTKKEITAELRKIKQPKIHELLKTLDKIKKDYSKAEKSMNKIINTGVPSYDKSFYKHLHKKKFKYFLDICGQ